MGSGIDAAIVSVSAARFDLDTGAILSTYQQAVSLKSAQRSGGKIDAPCVLEWLMKGDNERAVATGDSSLLIEVVLKGFSEFMREKPLEALWACGWDALILESAYIRSQKMIPWSWDEYRDFNTVDKLFLDYATAPVTIEQKINELSFWFRENGYG